ncbi:MAG: hypothetical protein E7384_07625 [Ruminococcaceae bacterium]|nr:hypothetical protein [Oscillospiraceae bacterium]
MRCVSTIIRFIKENCRGSVSVEAAIILPFMFLIFFVFVSIFQYAAAYLNVYQAADMTARYMSYYSGIYYREGLKQLDGYMTQTLYNEFGDKGSVAAEVFTGVTDNVACCAMANIIFNRQIEKNSNIPINNFYAIEKVSFAGSSFFKSGSKFELKVNCCIDTFFPLPEFFYKGYFIDIEIKGNGWLGGDYFIKESEPSVWELENFERGKIIEEYLGCNLPYDYPVVDSFDRKKGMVTLVRSIDHTTKTYLKTEQLKRTLEESLFKLCNFKGTEGHSDIDGDNVIRADKIKKRKLILVVPENDMTAAQTKVILEFSTKCVFSNVEFVLEKYQISY